VQDNVREPLEKLNSKNRKIAEWVSNTVQVEWIEKGDRGSKVFLGQHNFKAKS
jgi:hypothetical protein